MAEKIRQVRKQLADEELAALILTGTLIFGIWLRLNPAIQAGFPMNDGGMFLTMIEDLRQNGYHLPAFTSYNQLNIPFVYPPLAFYTAGFLSDVLRIQVTDTLLWLPAIINIATLPAFYLLAQAILKNHLKAALATLIYTLTPLSMDWFLMGGGLTRGMGQLFLILTCWGAWQLFHQPSRKTLTLTVLNGALVVLCHPESALLTLISVEIIWAFSARSKRSIIDGLLACAGITLLIAPWLVTVLGTHGVEPFINAAQTNGSQLLLWTKIFTFDFTQEALPGFVAVLGMIGLFSKVGEKKFFLPLWVAIPFFINPRSSARAAILPLAMLAAIALLDVLLPALAQVEEKATGKASGRAGVLLSGYVILSMLGGAYALGARMAANRLGEADRQDLAWVRENIPSGGRFVLITGETQLLRDPLQEWFPTLSGHISQTTLQGREWTSGSGFIDSIVAFAGLQSCFSQDAECIESETKKLGLSFEYLYIQKQTIMQCPEVETCRYNSKGLVENIKMSPNYRLVYESKQAAIFNKGKNAP